ncbi:MAG: hypothetical protein AAGH92_11120, partial [Planctomycetota bacterium]
RLNAKRLGFFVEVHHEGADGVAELLEVGLERSFRVTLDRPRDRTTLNFNPDFKKLRNTVSTFMMDLNEEAKSLRVETTYKLPDLEPADLTQTG